MVAIPTQDYDYESLNRLQRVYEGDWQTPTWHQTYAHDRWGNRTINQSTTNGVPKPNFGVDLNTNRLTAPAGYTMGYDAAGNLTNDTSTGQGNERMTPRTA